MVSSNKKSLWPLLCCVLIFLLHFIGDRVHGASVITSNFSHPCTAVADIVPPDADTIASNDESEFVAICNGAENFGSCGGDCCDGPDACTGATTWVKKDGSCNGPYVCQQNLASLVINSCHSGGAACGYFGSGATQRSRSVGQIIDSCHGESACFEVAYEEGSVGHLISSCSGQQACFNLAYESGEVGDVKNSCHGSFSCSHISYQSGVVGNLKSSCCAEQSCAHHCWRNETDLRSPPLPFPCGVDIIFFEESGMCPSEQPSSMPSASSMPSYNPSSIPSSSTSPSVSAVPSSAPSLLPSMLDAQIHSTVNDLETDVADLTKKVDGVQQSIETVENKTDALLKSMESFACSSSELVELKVSVQTRSFWQTSQYVMLLVTAGGTAIDADSDPVLWASSQSFGATSTVDVVDDVSIERVAEGFYRLGFYQSSSVYLLKVMVGGVEKTAMFDFVG